MFTIGGSAELCNSIITQNAGATSVNIAGNTTTNTFQMNTGAASGYIMQSDASGNGSWVSPTVFQIPQGIIVMWSGSFVSIPSGWALCDGLNGTPDLRDRFVLGATVNADVGITGGNHNHNITAAEMPSHNHTFTTASSTPSMTFTGSALANHTHIATAANNGAHTHLATSKPSNNTGWPDGSADTQGTSVNGSYWRGPTTDITNDSPTSSDGLHTHTITVTGVSAGTPDGTISGGSHSHIGTTDSNGFGTAFDIRPAFYKLAFIMKL
jgi:microcystin-dependent protein